MAPSPKSPRARRLDTPLAIIPRGTGNQVAQNLGIPLDLESAVDVAVSRRVTSIDLGLSGDRAFALVAGAGFDAAVMQAATRELKERWGFGAYVYAAVKEALTATPRRFHITADGREIDVEAVSVMVANVGELFARWLPLSCRSARGRPAPGRRPARRRHHRAAQPHDVAAMLWRAAQGRLTTSDRLLHFQTRNITIDADPPIAVQIDGDPAGMTPISMSVMRDAMRVMVPA
jgi:diacylglycerol kinase (ATP)